MAVTNNSVPVPSPTNLPTSAMQSSAKFGRNYSLDIQVAQGATITIAPPFTVEFDIVRNTYAGSNVLKLRIYNLSQKTRSQIAFNTFNQTEYRSMIFSAGYGDNIADIFSGNIHSAWSVREGVNFITNIECYDGGFALVNGEVGWQGATFPAGTTFNQVCTTIAEALPNVTIGAISPFNDPMTGAPITLKRSNTYSGNPAHILYEITGGGFYIDKQKVYVIQTNEYVSSSDVIENLIVINSDTGLLGTPVLEQTTVRFEMLFQPNLDIGKIVQLTSTTYQELNGIYKLTGVKHRGMISPVVCGDAITTGEFYLGPNLTPVLAETAV